jgi:hypothetical protein
MGFDIIKIDAAVTAKLFLMLFNRCRIALPDVKVCTEMILKQVQHMIQDKLATNDEQRY